jgi:peroxiredoxin
MVNGFRHQKTWLKILLWAFLIASAGILVPTGAAAEKVGPVVGKKAPDFILDSLAAKNVELYPVVKENKVTVVNFWGIWCPYCVREIPELVDFYNQYHQRGVEILAVNVGDNSKDIPPFAKKNKMIYFPILIDKNNAVSERYQITGFPTTVIIDRQGKITDIIVGATDQATLASKVGAALKEK